MCQHPPKQHPLKIKQSVNQGKNQIRRKNWETTTSKKTRIEQKEEGVNTAELDQAQIESS